MSPRTSIFSLLLITSLAAASEADTGVPQLLPELPGSPCVVNPAMRGPSLEQLELGDEASVRGDHEAARGHYRAALSVDPCSGFAWAQLGRSLLATGEPEAAEVALTTATRLVPTHFLFWTQLGEARRALGMKTEAVMAFQEALMLRPEHLPAERGLQRALREG